MVTTTITEELVEHVPIASPTDDTFEGVLADIQKRIEELSAMNLNDHQCIQAMTSLNSCVSQIGMKQLERVKNGRNHGDTVMEAATEDTITEN